MVTKETAIREKDTGSKSHCKTSSQVDLGAGCSFVVNLVQNLRATAAAGNKLRRSFIDEIKLGLFITVSKIFIRL